ncbi:MAG: phosphoribosylanthranilate isomerase [Promethearchaeota archaeon]
MTEIKICGVKDMKTVNAVIESKADYVGIVVGTPSSPRNLDIIHAKKLIDLIKKPVKKVVVTKILTFELVNKIINFNIDYLQFHGVVDLDAINQARQEIDHLNLIYGVSPRSDFETIKKIYGLLNEDDIVLIDGSQGHGCVNEESRLKDFISMLEKRLSIKKKELFLAGGLDPDNVCKFMTLFSPRGVDVSSGVEMSPGVKDPELIQKFCNNVRNCNEHSLK